MQNIKNNNSEKIDFRISLDNYYDFMLYKGNVNDSNIYESPIISKLTMNSDNFKNNIFYSEDIWGGAINKNGVKLSNFGYTGVDNGFIRYRKDRITNEEFLKIYTDSELTIPKDEKRFFVKAVTGNTLTRSYDIELKDEYISLNGGFFQGFFKVPDSCYQTLPDKIDNEITFNLKLRKRNDYEIKKDSINKIHPENKGFFLYIGTRGENKFWTTYNTDSEFIEKFNNNCVYKKDDYFEDMDIQYNDVINKDYIDKENFSKNDNIYNSKCQNDKNYDESYFDYDSDYHSSKKSAENECGIVDEYFSDSYSTPFGDGCPVYDKDYFKDDISLKDTELETNDGIDIKYRNITEISTDNKFIFFNHTTTGFTTNTWSEENGKIQLTHIDDYENINYFPLLNYTKNGHTVDTLEELKNSNIKLFNPINDITENSIGFKINDDGSISYRYIVKDCESEFGFKVEEEFSRKNMIKDNEWALVTVKIEKLTDKNMKIYFYVNEKIIFISKELPLLNLRKLQERNEKQEGVPYNLSIGGGTQGLSEAIYLDYYNTPDYTFPIEEHFCGSFVGDISYFSMKSI